MWIRPLYLHVNQTSDDDDDDGDDGDDDDKPRMLSFLLRKVEMPAIVGIVTFMNRKCSAELRMNFYNLWASLFCQFVLSYSDVVFTHI